MIKPPDCGNYHNHNLLYIEICIEREKNDSYFNLFQQKKQSHRLTKEDQSDVHLRTQIQKVLIVIQSALTGYYKIDI